MNCSLFAPLRYTKWTALAFYAFAGALAPGCGVLIPEDVPCQQDPDCPSGYYCQGATASKDGFCAPGTPAEWNGRDSGAHDAGFDGGRGDAGFDGGHDDAGFDAGHGDAGPGDERDAGIDAGTDAEVDAGLRDAGSDAAPQCGFDPTCASGDYHGGCSIACSAGMSCNLSGLCETPRYSVADVGTVTDEVTGLIWQQGTGPNSTEYEWDSTGTDTGSAQYYCTSLSLGSYASGWRLPTITELNSLFQVDQGGDYYINQPVLFTARDCVRS